MSVDANGDFVPGLKTTQWLAAVGIANIRDVARLGVIPTCILLKRAGHPVSLNMAYGLQADLMGTTWNRLPEAVKDTLREAYRHARDQADARGGRTRNGQVRPRQPHR